MTKKTIIDRSHAACELDQMGRVFFEESCREDRDSLDAPYQTPVSLGFTREVRI